MRIGFLPLVVLASVATASAAQTPAVVTRVSPTYPLDAYAHGIEGRVAAVLTIDKIGHVTTVKTVLEDPAGYGFGESAAAAFRQWVYVPNAPGDYTVSVHFAYVLPDDYSAAAAALREAPDPQKRVAPDYPQRAGRKGIPGRVVVALSVTDKGLVEGPCILQEDPLDFGFGDAALSAVRRWHFAKGQAGDYRATIYIGVKAPELTPQESKLLPAAPTPISRASPIYPHEAEEKEINGAAHLVVTVAADGSVANARIADEQPPGYGFGDAAVKAAMRWKFAAGHAGIYVLAFEFKFEGQTADVAVDYTKLAAAPEPEHRFTPRYPREAKEAGQEGSADIAVQINRNGQVTHAGLISETPKGAGFGRAAYDAVIQWRWSDEVPEGAYRVHVEFKLK